MQWAVVSVVLGLPLMTFHVTLGQYLGCGVLDMWVISPIFQVSGRGEGYGGRGWVEGLADILGEWEGCGVVVGGGVIKCRGQVGCRRKVIVISSIRNRRYSCDYISIVRYTPGRG